MIQLIITNKEVNGKILTKATIEKAGKKLDKRNKKVKEVETALKGMACFNSITKEFVSDLVEEYLGTEFIKALKEIKDIEIVDKGIAVIKSMKKTFKPELMRLAMILETRGESEARKLMTEYIKVYGEDFLNNIPNNMLFLIESAKTEIDADTVIAGLTGGAGAGALKIMVGATNLSAGAGLLQFNFKGCRKANLAVVRYDAGADLFDLEFIKTGTKKYMPYYTEVKKFTGLYTEDLKGVFENFTGLYTSL